MKPIAHALLPCLLASLLNYSCEALADGRSSRPAGVLVIAAKPELSKRFQELADTFQSRGSSAVADLVQGDLLNPEQLAQWQEFAQGSEVHVIDVQIHPNQARAIEWMNARFQRMGIPNLQFSGTLEESLPDPTALNSDSIRGRKWLRYLAGPGVAVAGFFLGLPNVGAIPSSDYVYLMIPAAGVGVTTVALELQFAWPWLNNVFWKKVWKFGGPMFGRMTNVLVNFLYGMSLYGAGVGAAHLPMLAGGAPVPFATLSVAQAFTTAAVGAVTYHVAMGQFQTDIANEEERGSIDAGTRYGLETTGVLVNNSARVLGWAAPAMSSTYGVAAQAGFFLLKTFPQLLKTNISDPMADREVHRALNPETAPPVNFGEKCARLMSKLSLINLPRMER